MGYQKNIRKGHCNFRPPIPFESTILFLELHYNMTIELQQQLSFIKARRSIGGLHACGYCQHLESNAKCIDV